MSMNDIVKVHADVKSAVKRLCEEGPYEENKKYIQHGRLSVFGHCVHVACTCCEIADRLHLPVSREELIRGALLHDFFLYDWHEPVLAHKIHGYTHPKKAMNNAIRFYNITKREKAMVRWHMFPLTPHPPTNLEAWIICISDKFCTVQEVMKAKRDGIYEKRRNAARNNA